jgi:hypothetical protein
MPPVFSQCERGNREINAISKSIAIVSPPKALDIFEVAIAKIDHLYLPHLRLIQL